MASAVQQRQPLSENSPLQFPELDNGGDLTGKGSIKFIGKFSRKKKQNSSAVAAIDKFELSVTAIKCLP